MFCPGSAQTAKKKAHAKELQMTKWIAIFSTCIIFSCVAFASEDTGPRRIVQIGCVLTTGQCYVSVSGTPVGSTFGCSSTSVRWNADNTASGNRWFVLLYGAYLKGKTVDFNISGCYPDSPEFPTFLWANVQDAV